MDDKFFRQLNRDEHDRLVFLERIKNEIKEPKFCQILAYCLFLPVSFSVLLGLYIFTMVFVGFLGLCGLALYQSKKHAIQSKNAVNCYYNYLKKLINKYKNTEY